MVFFPSVLINIKICTFCPVCNLNFNKNQLFFNYPLLHLEQPIILYYSDFFLAHSDFQCLALQTLFCPSKQMPSTLFRSRIIQRSNSCSFYINTVHVCFNFLIGSTHSWRQYSSLGLALRIQLVLPCSVALQFTQSVYNPYGSFYSSAMQGIWYSCTSVSPACIAWYLKNKV